MQTKGRATSAEVIHEWLKAELWSKRYGKIIKLALRKLKLPLKLILHPNLRNIRQNQQREKLLRSYRKDFFTNFPEKITWELMSLTREDLAKIKYHKYDNRQAEPIVKYLANHGYFPKIILGATHTGARMMVLEGHLRLTAFLLAPDLLPKQIKAFVGYSQDFSRLVLE